MRTLYAIKNALTNCCLTALVALAAFGPASAQTNFGPFSASPAAGIPDNTYNGTLGSMASSAVAVSGVTGTSVVNIEVDVDITHTWIGDLVIKLQSPDGDILTLVSRPGAAETADDGISAGGAGSSANLGGAAITFSDLSANDAELMGLNVTTSQSVCLNAGFCNFFPNPGASTHPTQTFASLFGGNMNGTWTLYVGDRAVADVGTLNSWSIRISTVSPSLLAFIGVAVEDGNGDCADDPLPATLTNTLNVAAGTNVCYFYYGENTGDVTLNLHDVNDDVFGALVTGLPFALDPATAAFLAVGPVTINSTVTNNATWDAYNAGPTDLASSSASATVFLIPDNDLCADAIALTCGESVTGTTLGASDAGNNAALDCGELAGDLGVWYTFVGTGNQMSLSTCGPVSDVNDPVFMAVYTGGCGAFSCVINNGTLVPAAGCGFANGQELIFATTEGETYHVFVASWTGGTVDFDLSLDCADCNGDFGGTAFVDGCGVCVGGNTGLTACPNLCADAVDVSCGDVITGTTVGATNADAPATCVTSLNTAPGLWYHFVGNGDNVTASLAGSAYDTKIGVFSGACGSLVCVTGNDDFNGLQSQAGFSSVAGTDYYIYVTGFGTTSGAFTLTLTCAPPACTNAIAIDCGDVVNGTTVGATADPAAGTCGTSLTSAPGVYYVVQGTGLDITASLCGSAYDTKLGVFSGTCGTPLSCVVGNDDFDCADEGSGLQSQVTFTSVLGENYYIYVTGFSTNTGNYTLSVTCAEPPCDATAGTLTADASPVSLVGGSAIISATEGTAPFVPAGYSVLYVLTEGAGLVIIDAAATPSFTVSAAGDYTIHTLVFDPATLDVSSVVFGTTTGFDVNGLLIQGGGTICGALDVAGAPIVVEAEVVCDATAGTLVADASPVTLVGGSATISATEGTAPFVPAGYSVLYVLTEGAGLVIIDAAATPSFTVSATGDYTIHTLVFDPTTLDVTSVVFGTTTGFDVNGLLIQGGGTICGALDVAGAPIVVDEVVGLSENLNGSLSVYPNPSNGQFIVEMNGAEGVGTLNIMDMMGRRVYTAGVNFNGSFRQSIDLNVAKGTYVLQVITENGIATRKVELN